MEDYLPDSNTIDADFETDPDMKRPATANDNAANKRAHVETSTPSKPRKRAHYLQHAERCCVIKRVANGEPQAALAREFGITRAAVCQMYKKRFEILSREESDEDEDAGTPTVAAQAKVVLLLLTTLRDKRSKASAFIRAAVRLTTILIEETMASLDARTVELIAASGRVYSGLEQQQQRFCGVTLSDEALSFATAFREIQPDDPVGCIHLDAVVNAGEGPSCWRLERLDLPVDIVDYEILLFSSSCGTGGAQCKAIEALCSVGVLESSISLVTIVCASVAFDTISTHFPEVTIISAVIDDDWTIARRKPHLNGAPASIDLDR